ncbi:acyltransferase family protein [Colwellia hornerae]|uniref:Acyltransferase n=1 Tax=Colwellia hornerae TaxID=89402 RepID=A0A5C6Q9L6_9GAMM|nr:acyltransferase [Colwellia hornerae]TWX51087.1 acyltransferase [Colwellia hornerae]TWX56765.1 acyltransferase [Colwellia hornerae]TWX65735.1 acyltransferase [Colwellia hornerae]
MKYQKEIDGLRALAIIPVLLFHLGIPFLTGGYLGVDVFFVISGFLITKIILDEIVDGNFSLVNFYERRVRRIMPALVMVVVVGITLPFLSVSPV